MATYAPVEMKRKKSGALILQCADPRFQQAYRQIIDNLGLYYDLVERAGASKGIVENPTTIEEIKMLHNLHDFSEIHILDHVDCGAYGPLENELAAHSQYLKRATELIKKALPNIKVVPHLLGEEEEIRLPADLTT